MQTRIPSRSASSEKRDAPRRSHPQATGREPAREGTTDACARCSGSDPSSQPLPFLPLRPPEPSRTRNPAKRRTRTPTSTLGTRAPGHGYKGETARGPRHCAPELQTVLCPWAASQRVPRRDPVPSGCDVDSDHAGRSSKAAQSSIGHGKNRIERQSRSHLPWPPRKSLPRLRAARQPAQQHGVPVS